MKRLIALLLIFAIFLSGCVGQPTTKVEKATTTTTTQPVKESPEFSHDLDQALDDLSQVE